MEGAAGGEEPRRLGFALLKTNATFRRLWIARLVSFLGDAIGLVALILYTTRVSGTGAAVGLLLVAGDFTPTLLSPIVGAIADRIEARRIMIASELAQGLAIGLIALLRPSLPLLLTLVAAQAAFAALFRASSRSVVADLVDDRDLEAANALIGAGTHGLEAVGPMAAAGFLVFMDPRAVLALDVATFAVSAALLFGLPLSGRAGEERSTRLMSDAVEGLRWLWRDRVLRTVAFGFFAVVAFTGVDDVALVFLAKESFGASDSAVGVLYAGTGVGLLLGFVLLLSRTTRVKMLAMVLAGLALASAGNLLTGVAPALLIAFAMQLVRGLGISLVDVGTNTVVQRSVPPEMRGRVFANLYGLIGLAAAISYVVGGPLVDALSARTVLVLAGAGGLAATVVAGLSLARRATRPDAGDPSAPAGSSG